MSMGGFDKEEHGAPLAEINTTPLVDVMLVLLVIFLVTAPMLTQAVKLELPNETATEIADRQPLTLSIIADGGYFWEKEKLDETALEQRLMAVAQKNPAQPIHLRADTHAEYGKVSKLLAAAQRHGLNNIGFITEQK